MQSVPLRAIKVPLSLRTSDRCHWCGNPPVVPRIIASRMSLRTSGAPRSEFEIIMTAGGSHTIMWRTLVWPPPGIPSGHNPSVFPSASGYNMSLRTSVATLVWPFPRIPSGHNLYPCLLCGRGAPQGRRGRFYPLSHFVTAPPEWEPRGNEGYGLPRQCAHCLAMTWFFDSLASPYGREARSQSVPQSLPLRGWCSAQRIQINQLPVAIAQ